VIREKLNMTILPLQTIPTDHPAKAQVLAKMGADNWLVVKRNGVGEPRHCYENVHQLVKEQGGEVVLGWMVDVVPGIYVELMHHAIWKTPDDRHLDVTKPQDRSRDEHGDIVFIPDSSVQVDLEHPIPVTNQYVSLVKDTDLREYLRQYILSIDLYRKAGELGPAHPKHDDIVVKFKKARSTSKRLARRLRRRYFPDLES